MKTYQITAGFLMVCTVAGITAYPDKVTITNASTDEVMAYATLIPAQATPQRSRVSQTIPAHGTVTFQGNMYTKIKVVGRVMVGTVSQGDVGLVGGFETAGSDEDSLAFTKGSSGEIKLQFDASHKLKIQ